MPPSAARPANGVALRTVIVNPLGSSTSLGSTTGSAVGVMVGVGSGVGMGSGSEKPGISNVTLSLTKERL